MTSLLLLLLVLTTRHTTNAINFRSFSSLAGGATNKNNDNNNNDHHHQTPPTYTNEKIHEDGSVSYGVDVSFPIHRLKVSDNYPWLDHNVHNTTTTTVPKAYENKPVQVLGYDRQQFYEEFIEGCRKYYGKRGEACDSVERDRIEMSVRQPQSMVNYTDIGFKKLKAPDHLMNTLKQFWEDNKHTQKQEQWFTGNTYTNNWESPTYMVSVEDTQLRGGGYKLKQRIWDFARDTLQEWTGQELTPCSLYGIRVYKTNAVLSTHVDRLPLVSSAIINVAQDVTEPWPIEVYGHDGKAYNVTMEPGDMVLYESHSVLHGRPFPLKGEFFANIFIHFEPTGHSLRHHGQDYADANTPLDVKYKTAVQNGHGGHENLMAAEGLPPYILAGTPEEKHYKAQHPEWQREFEDRQQQDIRDTPIETGSTAAHFAAQHGDIDTLRILAETDKDSLNAADSNGWLPVHEGARGGHKEVVELLVDNGADVNVRTNHGTGGTPLWWAKSQHGSRHPLVKYLTELGALEIGPEL